MFDSRLYREACRELRAPEEKVEEIVTMSQQNHTKSRRPVRAVLIAAAAAAMMAVGVARTNAQGQKTTRIVTARIISPVKNQVKAAEVRAMTTIQVAQRSAIPTILALPASAD